MASCLCGGIGRRYGIMVRCDYYPVTTVLFVHGTGVRRVAYDASIKRFAAKLAAVRPDVVVARCYWGDDCGAKLNLRGVSIPTGDSTRALGPVASEVQDTIALWGLLYDDPLAELRLLSTSDTQPARELPPNAPPPGRKLAADTRALAVDPTVAPLLSAAGLDAVFAAAVDTVLDSGPGREALRREAALAAALRGVLARAVVAQAMLAADEALDGALALDGAHRDELVTAIVAALGGSDRGLGRWLGNLALRAVMSPVERRRTAITHAAAPTAGDVLLYLARGGGIRAFIAAELAKIDPTEDVVIVAHSLGGIASLELLVTDSRPQVKLLVTVGSQAPFLYEINALPMLAYPDELPASVPTWINVYDVRDLLSYTGAGVFPGRVTDKRLDNRAPFPHAHSDYFANDAFYDILHEALP